MNHPALPNRAARNRRDTVILGMWTAAWLATTALASFGSRLLWQDNLLLTWLMIMLSVATGIGMVVANARHLKSMDELQQRVTLNAMGIALGAGLVGGIAFSLLDSNQLIAFKADISVLIVGMGLTYIVATFAGLRHYR